MTAAEEAAIEAALTTLQRAELDLSKRAIDLTRATALAGDLPDAGMVAADLAHRRAAIAYVVEELRAYGKDTEWVTQKLREISESIS